MDDGTNPASVASGPNSDLSQQPAVSLSMRKQLVTLNSITTITTVLCTEKVSQQAIKVTYTRCLKTKSSTAD